MKNYENYDLRTSIVMTCTNFQRLIRKIYGPETFVEIDYDGTTIDPFSADISEEDILNDLSEYFGVTVTSFHADDKEPCAVWIVYREEKK